MHYHQVFDIEISTFCHTMHLYFITDLRTVNIFFTALADLFLTQMDLFTARYGLNLQL